MIRPLCTICFYSLTTHKVWTAWFMKSAVFTKVNIAAPDPTFPPKAPLGGHRTDHMFSISASWGTSRAMDEKGCPRSAPATRNVGSAVKAKPTAE